VILLAFGCQAGTLSFHYGHQKPSLSLFNEFKRRKVFKLSAAYLVVAWVLIQIADTVAPQLNLPEWAPRLITLILLLGFPLVLVLAWIFDLTPEGIRVEIHTAKDNRIFITAGFLAAAVVTWYLWDRHSDIPVDLNERSIAVLPFVNISGDPENEYFSDGISEEILNDLARMPELRVAARTSSFAFKDQQKEVPEIAAALNVALVLEGSVRRQGEQVRISAQLIDAASGFNLWSDTYDRSLRDVFKTQDEIADEVARALQLQLGSRKRAHRSEHKIHPDTYDKYLRARDLLNKRGSVALKKAAALFEEVIVADPQFAEAYAGLGHTYTVMPLSSVSPPVEIRIKSRNAAEHALALDSELAEAYGALGDVATHELRFEDADALLRRAITEGPSIWISHIWLGEKQFFTGELEDARKHVEEAKKQDPLWTTAGGFYAYILLAMEQPKEARDACESLLDMAPDYEPCRTALLLIALATQDSVLARRVLIDSAHGRDDNTRQMATTIADALEGAGDRRSLARQLMDTSYHAIYDRDQPGIVHDKVLPALLLALGEPELAIQRLAVNAEAAPKNVLDVIWDPQLDQIRCEDAFQKIVTQLKVHDRRADRICSD